MCLLFVDFSSASGDEAPWPSNHKALPLDSTRGKAPDPPIDSHSVLAMNSVTPHSKFLDPPLSRPIAGNECVRFLNTVKGKKHKYKHSIIYWIDDDLYCDTKQYLNERKISSKTNDHYSCVNLIYCTVRYKACRIGLYTCCPTMRKLDVPCDTSLYIIEGHNRSRDWSVEVIAW